MRVKKGEIYISADKSKCGHLVLDVEKYKHCDDVITQPFTASGLYNYNSPVKNFENRIDKFKLTMVRYYRCDEIPLPDWIPAEIIEMRAKM